MSNNNSKKFNYLHYICLLITASFLLCSIFLFQFSAIRTVDSIKDFGLSIAYYFTTLLSLPFEINPSINTIPENFTSSLLPFSSDLLSVKISMYFHSLINSENLSMYFGRCLIILINILKIILVILPFFLVFQFLLKRLMNRENNDYNKDSKALIIFKRISAALYIPFKKWIINFVIFIRESRLYFHWLSYWLLWLLIWLFNLNIFTMIMELLAFLFYFILSFDFVSIYTFFYRLFFDISVMLNFMPVFFWVLLALIIFCIIRVRIAYRILNYFEANNRDFIDKLPIVTMFCGTMGKKKTTIMTDVALSQQVMFRDKAFELILENDLKFPYFPWINLENEIKKAIKYHQIYNRATCKLYIQKRCRRFELNPCREKCFDYDYIKYGLTYNDNLKVLNLFEVLETYTQLYFIYIIESSLLVSNYSIREDNLISDLGNFPIWDNDFFKRDSRLIDSYSRHSHILDFDSLRLGRKVIEENYKADSFEFGVVAITEVGKERGNQLENKGKKKTDDETNQLNDLFNSSLKMCRHPATVDNFSFIKMLLDEQRPESLGADARELCNIVHILNSSDSRIVLPFFFIENMVCEFFISKFKEFYYNFRYLRADNTLFSYLFKALVGKVFGYYKRVWNKFSYIKVALDVEEGTLDGNRERKPYYLMSKKIYSKRFSTDCFSDYFAEKALKSPVGLNDLEEYKTVKASFKELQSQNSYFINDLLKQQDNETLSLEEKHKDQALIIAGEIMKHPEKYKSIEHKLKAFEEREKLASKLVKYGLLYDFSDKDT